MAIAPKFKPGQLVKYNHPANPLVGLVKSTQFARRRGEPALVLVCLDLDDGGEGEGEGEGYGSGFG